MHAHNWVRVLGTGLAVALATGAHAQPTPTNLIVNGSAEEPLINGEIPGWTEVLGSGWRYRTGNPPPFDGQSYFFAGTGTPRELAQTVDVSAFSASIDAGIQSFNFDGHVRSFSQSPQDLSRIALAYLDASGTKLASFDSGEIASVPVWQLVSNSMLAPPTTRAIHIRLISRRRAGTNNDGYFDALSLVPDPAPCYADCDGSGTLDILDYICFGDAFAAGAPYADCDGSGSLNILDYICSGDAFAAGCS